MATIANLNVNLGMNTAKFSAGAKSAKQEIAGLSKGINFTAIASGALAAMEAIRLVVDGVQMFAAVVKQAVMESVELVDSTDELAQSLGTNVESLSRLQFAAKQAGSDSEALTTAMQKMNLTLGKAAGNKQLEATLSDLGLNLNELLALDPSERFIAIAEALRKIQNPAVRAAMGAKIFGKNVTGVMNAINAGGDTLREFMADSDAIGNTIGELDAAAIGALDNEINRLEGAWNGVQRIIAAELAPVLVEVLSVVTTMLAGVHEMRKGFVGAAQAATLMVDPTGATAELVKQIALGWELDAKLRAAAAKAAADAAGAMPDLDDVIDSADKVAELAKEITMDIALFGLKGNERKIVELKLSGASDEEIKNLRNAAYLLDKLEQREQLKADAERIKDDIATPYQKAFEAQAKLNALRKQGLLTEQEFAAASKQNAQEYVENLKKQQEAAKSLTQKSAEERVKNLQTPLQTLNKELAEIQKEFAAGFLSSDQAALAELLARKEHAETLPDQEELTGNPRAAALERGTSAAFSASFGPVAKPLDKLTKINQEILAVQRRIEEKLE